MEKLPTKNNQQQITSITCERSVKQIAKIIVDVNKLVAFQLDGPILTSWAEDIDRLMTPEGKEKLPFLMDCFKTGKLFYDKSEGIQNIFNNLKFIKKVGDNKFEILRAIW